MGKRQTNPAAKPLTGIYDDAFRLQEGEYYPEHHRANVKTLCEKYPDYSAEEVDAIYREACKIEPAVEEWLGNMELSPASRAELLEWLKDHFFGFTNQSFLWALERVEDRRR